MPKGPRRETRPSVFGRAIAEITTGEVRLEVEIKSAAAELGRRGGKARAAKMSAERRAEIARSAANRRWKG